MHVLILRIKTPPLARASPSPFLGELSLHILLKLGVGTLSILGQLAGGALSLCSVYFLGKLGKRETRTRERPNQRRQTKTRRFTLLCHQGVLDPTTPAAPPRMCGLLVATSASVRTYDSDSHRRHLNGQRACLENDGSPVQCKHTLSQWITVERCEVRGCRRTELRDAWVLLRLASVTYPHTPCVDVSRKVDSSNSPTWLCGLLVPTST